MSESDPPARPLWQRLLLDWGLPLLGVVVVVVVVGRLRAPSLPEQAPDFTLVTLDGEQVQLASLQGRTVVLNFWATWCGPCRMEIPSISTFADHHPELTVLGVVADGPEEKVRQVSRQLGVGYPVLMGDPQTLGAYGVQSYPTTVVIDPDGHVHTAHVGIITRPQLWYATRPWSL